MARNQAETSSPYAIVSRLRIPLALTRAGLLAEQVLRSFWPLLSVMMLALAVLMLGLHDMLPVEVVWTGAVLTALAGLIALVSGIRRFHWPSRAEALIRLDESLPGRPIQALLDDQAIGAGDTQSEALWRAHQARMASRAADAKPVRPDLRLSRRDPFALRYLALLALCVALLFGSFLRVGTVTQMAPGAALASGPTWEGWIAPPRYTGLPTIYLNDITENDMTVPVGSEITVRFYGELGALTLAETVSGRTEDLPSAADPQQDFTVTQDGTMRIDGTGGREWAVSVIQDASPSVAVAGQPDLEASGAMTLPFEASDDYEVTGGQARITLDLDAVDRRHGLRLDPEVREQIVLDLPLPITGDRSDFIEELIEDFSQHPWANLPVRFDLTVRDAADQAGVAAPSGAALPARRFFDPMAAAIIEQRRDLLWTRDNAPRIAMILRAISHRPEKMFRSEIAYLRLRMILRRLETFTEFGLTTDQRDELAQALWDLAIKLEDGDLGDALERMRRAQERLSQAMKDGASDQEIAELMQELRDATQDYMRQLSRQAQQENGEQQPGQPSENAMQMTQDDLQRMMDRIQELMEQGRMAEAEQALQELQELMENMRVTQGQGQNGQSEGQQAMEGLADTLRQQQGLSDQAFRDLQEQFNPGAQAGESQNNEGRDGGQGRGQAHSGQGGRGSGDNPEGQSGREGTDQGTGMDRESLADRQQALRDELNRQQQGLPGAGTPEGDAARDALGRAGEAMDEAEDSLRQNDLAEAIDNQSDAMEALREGMRSLGEAMAQEQNQQPGQGNQEGNQQAQRNDPLGRQLGRGGSLNGEENMLQGEDVYRRARDLLDEIRRRSGDSARPDVERNYLQRLLDRF
jgi:uncharacterized protein (TIGR02302 family)